MYSWLRRQESHLRRLVYETSLNSHSLRDIEWQFNELDHAPRLVYFACLFISVSCPNRLCSHISLTRISQRTPRLSAGGSLTSKSVLSYDTIAQLRAVPTVVIPGRFELAITNVKGSCPCLLDEGTIYDADLYSVASPRSMFVTFPRLPYYGRNLARESQVLLYLHSWQAWVFKQATRLKL